MVTPTANDVSFRTRLSTSKHASISAYAVFGEFSERRKCVFSPSGSCFECEQRSETIDVVLRTQSLKGIDDNEKNWLHLHSTFDTNMAQRARSIIYLLQASISAPPASHSSLPSVAPHISLKPVQTQTMNMNPPNSSGPHCAQHRYSYGPNCRPCATYIHAELLNVRDEFDMSVLFMTQSMQELERHAEDNDGNMTGREAEAVMKEYEQRLGDLRVAREAYEIEMRGLVEMYLAASGVGVQAAQ